MKLINKNQEKRNGKKYAGEKGKRDSDVSTGDWRWGRRKIRRWRRRRKKKEKKRGREKENEKEKDKEKGGGECKEEGEGKGQREGKREGYTLFQFFTCYKMWYYWHVQVKISK